MTEYRQIRLPEDLCVTAEKKFGDTFSSAEDLLTFVLRALLQDKAFEADSLEAELVEQRLKELGYL